MHSCRELDRTWLKRNTYSRQLAKNLCTVFSTHTAAFASSPTVHLPSVFHSRTLREFDTLCTSAAFGYATVDDYYRDASSAAFVSSVRTACLFVSCLDDPICDAGGIPVDECEGNECCLLLTVAGGGHSMCLYEGWRPDSYCVQLIRHYAEAVIDVLDSEASGGGMSRGEQIGEWVAQPPPMVRTDKDEVVSDGLVAPEGLDDEELREHWSHLPQPPPSAAFNSSPHQTSPTRPVSASTDCQQQADDEVDHTVPTAARSKVEDGTGASGEPKEAGVEQSDGAVAGAGVDMTAAMADMLDTLITFTRRTRLLLQSSS